MHALRQARCLARLALAWLLLAMGVAVAGPVVQPRGLELVCTGSGMAKLIVKTADGGELQTSPARDCPLCLVGGTPPPPPRVTEPPAALAQAPHPVAVAALVALTRSPLPARGPPSPA